MVGFHFFGVKQRIEVQYLYRPREVIGVACDAHTTTGVVTIFEDSLRGSGAWRPHDVHGRFNSFGIGVVLIRIIHVGRLVPSSWRVRLPQSTQRIISLYSYDASICFLGYSLEQQEHVVVLYKGSIP